MHMNGKKGHNEMDNYIYVEGARIVYIDRTSFVGLIILSS